MRDLKAWLRQRKADHLYRRRRTTDSPQAPLMQVDGRQMLVFCSNDYLGLAADPRLAAAFKRGVDAFGVGSGAAHLLNGHSRAHHQLEEALAEFTGRPRALLFSTGYMANLGTIAALAGRGDTVLQDRLNHASLLDGGLLSGARLMRYAHADPRSLRQRLQRGGGEKLVISDGVFSMDGDIAPLPALASVCQENDAPLMVDDAHGLGVLGSHGGGVCEHFGLSAAEVPILVGTLGKALGTAGAFVAGSEELIEYLIQAARPYIYTTAQPPAVASATLAALEIAREESERREKLGHLIQRFRQGCEQLGLALGDSCTPIQPVIVGEAEAALRLSQTLESEGLLVPAIRPPTVPAGTARLRVTLTAAHSEAQVDRLLDALAKGVAQCLQK